MLQYFSAFKVKISDEGEMILLHEFVFAGKVERPLDTFFSYLKKRLPAFPAIISDTPHHSNSFVKTYFCLLKKTDGVNTDK